MDLVDQLHQGFETRNYQLISKITTKDFMKDMVGRGGLQRFVNIFPPDTVATRITVNKVKTQKSKVSTIDNIYIIGEEIVTIKDLIWEIKENNVWKIDKFWVLEIEGEQIFNPS